MLKMDLQTSAENQSRTGEPVSCDTGSIFFKSEEQHRGQSMPRRTDSNGTRFNAGRQSLARRRAGLAIGVGACAAIACFGLAMHRWRRPDIGSVTASVPAAQSIAVIKALPPPNLLKPLSPQQAAQENADRPFVSRPDTAAARFVLHTDADNRTSAVTCLAQAVYYEAAGEGMDGGRAVAQVVLNRLRHPGFPSTVCGVVYQGADRATGCQFSFTCDGSMQRIPVPSLWTRSKQIAEEALKGHVFTPVGHATHYHADYVLPYWADSLDKSVQIGRHIFYRLRSSVGDPRAFSQRYAGTEPPFREPGAAVVIAQTPDGQRAASTLISDSAPAPAAAKLAGNAPPKPEIPLLIDATASKLLIDGQTPAQPVHRRNPTDDCNISRDVKPATRLSATDMRSGLSASGC
jgi:spore germination cell wall hydrolase CwlJ-like protein